MRRLKLPAYVDDMSEVQAAEKRLLQDEEDFTRPIMERAASYLIEAGIPADRVETKIALGVASRAEAIVRRAREDNFGAIVLGRRRPSRLEEFFLGRVSDKVFQIARQRAVFMVGLERPGKTPSPNFLLPWDKGRNAPPLSKNLGGSLREPFLKGSLSLMAWVGLGVISLG